MVLQVMAGWGYRVSIGKRGASFRSPRVGKEEFVVGLCRDGSPAEDYRDHNCLNFPSAWLGEFPLRAPGYLKIRISTWEHVTGSLRGVALHLTSGWAGGWGRCQLRALRQTSA